MTAVTLPYWTSGAGWLVLCGVAILVDSTLTRRRRRRRREARRLAALDALWLDAVGAGGEVRPSSSVSRGLEADTASASIYPWPRVKVYARSIDRAGCETVAVEPTAGHFGDAS